MKKKFEVLFYAIGIILMVWIFVSWIDTSIHHIDESYEYSYWNLFEIFYRIRNGLG